MLVSAIMPTRGRQQWAAQALEAFQRQQYPFTELVVIDDADDPSFPGALDIPHVQYHRLPRRLSIAQKRNLACSRASGDLIAHWDSDDFSAPGRLADQVARMTDRRSEFDGYHSMIFVDEAARRAWKYVGSRDYQIGTSFLFTRGLWKAVAFRDATHAWGEDNLFRDELIRRSVRMTSADADCLMFARTHAGNTSRRDTTAEDYRSIPWEQTIRKFEVLCEKSPTP